MTTCPTATTPRYEAVTITEVAVDTVPAVTAKVAELAPCATVTFEGNVNPTGELDRLTTAPPDPAGLLSRTVPIAELPLTMELGAIATPDKAAPGGFTVTAFVLFAPR
jgi:hypothetical protein